jgi:large conductance mechanosensitive channel
MGGFKAFILKGNLIEIATGLIMALAFASVVTSFTEWLTGLLPETDSNIFSTRSGSFGAFLNATISFLIMAAVVYFFIVVPYTKAKERFFPAEEPGTPADVALLEEIRDLLAARGGTAV